MTELQDSIHLKLSSMGGIVCVDGRADELILTGIADGTAVAGMVVFMDATLGATCGDLIGINVNSSTDNFVGILLPKYNTDCDTAITNGDMAEYVVPKKGHRYNVKIEDPSTGHSVGEPVTLAANGTGLLSVAAGEVEDFCWAWVSRAPASTSLFCEVMWN